MSCSTNHWRTAFSLFVLALPLPREAAPVSSTIAARPLLFSEARMCCAQPQSADCAPRMLHAASQIQDSSDLPLALVMISRRLGSWENNHCLHGSGRIV